MHRDSVSSPAQGGRARRRPTARRLTVPSLLLTLAFAISACGGASEGTAAGPDLPPTSAEEFAAHLASLDRPAVVNVWASWCLPCRAEAPLLDQAHATHGDQIEFIGVDVQDSQAAAQEFLAEFHLDFDHFFDPDREVPAAYGGYGTPLTLFFGPGGDLVRLHNGVIDDRALALNIDELLRLEP